MQPKPCLHCDTPTTDREPVRLDTGKRVTVPLCADEDACQERADARDEAEEQAWREKVDAATMRALMDISSPEAQALAAALADALRPDQPKEPANRVA